MLHRAMDKKFVTPLRQSLRKEEPDSTSCNALAAKMLHDFMIARHVTQFQLRLVSRDKLQGVKACSNEADMLVQHHPTLLDGLV